MNRNRMPLIRFSLLFALLPLATPIFAQNKKDSSQSIRALVENQLYTFRAQTALPMSGRIRQLDYGYDIRVSKEKIVAYLPYFGRAYTAPVDPSKGGIQFTSQDFDYTVTEKKKGSWVVVIRTKDLQETQQLQLSIFNSGSATLQVNGSSRQTITFNGTVSAPDKKKGD